MAAKKAGRGEGVVEMFSTPGGIRTVDSQARMDILSMLLKREMSFDELVASSGKAKSTVSVHLKGLVEEGVIGSREDPDDARKKIFYITSSYLGRLSKRKRVDRDMEDYISSYAAGSSDPFTFFRLMFRTLRVSLLNEGIDIDPVLHDAGVKVGEALCRKVEAPEVEGLLENLAAFWKAQSLGKIEVESVEPLAIRIYDCFECQELPPIGRPACAFDSGILESVFSRHFEERMRAIETACYAMGDDHCRFEVRKVA
jgi:predicted hydrocarbon binding protein